MSCILFVVGLSVVLVVLDKVVRRVAGDHPHFDGRTESHFDAGSHAGAGSSFGGDGGDG